jgi:hypothetical protein
MARASREKLGLTQRSVVASEVELEPHEKLAELYRRVFSGGDGKAVLDDLKKRFGDRRSFVPDSNATAFHEGQRDVYQMIVALIERDITRPQGDPTDGGDGGS